MFDSVFSSSDPDEQPVENDPDADTDGDAETEADGESAETPAGVDTTTEFDPSLLDSADQTLLSEDYHITPTGHEYAAGTEAKTLVDPESDDPNADDDAVAGPFIREMFEFHRHKPRQHLWLGYDDDPQEGFREAGIPFEEMRKHLWLSGASGSGKTTEELNLMTQLGYGGHGFVYIDPKGDDSRELLRMLPADRLDDVVWVEPGSHTHEKSVQLNFLELPDWVRDANREEAVEDRLQNLKAIFDTDEYWGINQESITESMGRAMMNSDDDYTIIDFFSILLDQERREQFAASVDDPFVKAFCRQIAEMDNDAVRPLMKRVKKWAESPTVRRIIAARESTVDFREIVEDDKIVIVRTSTTNTDIKRMLALGVIRNIWSAIQHRSFASDTNEKPFFIVCDEFDEIISKNLDVESMLARARSKWLSLIISCQYPNQIEKKSKDVLDAMENNCANLGAFRTFKKEDARIMTNRFRKYGADVLLDSNEFEIWTKLPQGGGRYSGGVKLNTFAPYPPLRDEDAVDEIIDASLERYGAEPLSDTEIQQELKFGRLGEMVAPDHVDEDNIPPKRLLECVFVAVAQQYDDPDGTEQVAFDRIHEEFERRTGVDITQAKLSNPIEELDGEYLDYGREGEPKVSLTNDGHTKLFEQDTGDAENAGGPEHRYILRECFKTFLGMGADAYLPSQGGEELPDGVADLPISPLDEAETDAEYQDLKATCKEEYGPLYDLSDGKDIAIEAETTTLEKPKQTLTNLRKAVEQEKKCVFACKDGSYDESDFDDPDDAPDHASLFEYWARRGERIIYDTEGSGGSITTDFDQLTFCRSSSNTDRVFYNRAQPLQIEPGVTALRPKTSHGVRWRERSTGEADTDTEITVEENNGENTVRARFESVEGVFNAEREDVPAYYEITDKGNYVVHRDGSEKTFETKDALTDNWVVLREPFIPEHEFTDSTGDTRVPNEDEFAFIIYPDDNNDEYDGPHIYEHGELRPLDPADSTSDTEDTAATEDATEAEAGTARQSSEGGENDCESGNGEQVESIEDDKQPGQQSAEPAENTDEGNSLEVTEGEKAEASQYDVF